MYAILYTKLEGSCPEGYFVPCNPLNITKLYGKIIKDIKIYTVEEVLNFVATNCPNKCTEQYYDVIHTAFDIPSYTDTENTDYSGFTNYTDYTDYAEFYNYTEYTDNFTYYNDEFGNRTYNTWYVYMYYVCI